ncbi:MAG: hypothetical protein OEU26_24415 [Candidatus Tectomicrobia bacterium]|nr:hypothetical protein [Candidatus Tectomicrobia bacterium]
MTIHPYLYTYNRQAGRLLIDPDDGSYRFHTASGNEHPLSLDDEIHLDTPEAAFLAEADALLGAWRELCESAGSLPNPAPARQTLRECVEVMRTMIDTGGGDDPAPAQALLPAA